MATPLSLIRSERTATTTLNDPMIKSNADLPTDRPRVAAIMPLVWRPDKVNFSRVWELLSREFEGAVFTLSEPGTSGTWIGRFRFISASGNGLIGKIQRLWVQSIGVLLEAGRRGRFDVVMVYDPYASGLAGVLVSIVMRARLIVELNGDYHEVEPEGPEWKRRLMRRIMRGVLRRASAVRVLNRSQETFVRERYPDTRVHRFAEFTPVDLFLQNEPTEGEYFLFVGFPFHLKGVDILIRAYRKVWSTHPELRLRIMGHCPPPNDEPFRELAQGCPGIEFLPPAWIDDVAREMRGAIALVNPARTEALGRVHIEAMASSLPVIATATNGAKEVIEPHETGLLVEIEDVDGLAEALLWVAENREAAREMGERGRKRVQERYTEETYRDNVATMIYDTLS